MLRRAVVWAGCASLLYLCFFCTAAAWARESPKKDYALIYGTVWGPDDRPVPGVPISIRKTNDKKARWQLVSNSQGEFAQRVPAGAQDYVVRAEIKSTTDQARPELKVHIDNDERQDISLHLTQQQLSLR